MVATYMEMNPVRARMVAHPEEYPWSSFAANDVVQFFCASQLSGNPCWHRASPIKMNHQAAFAT
jgi:hypothetical protein